MGLRKEAICLLMKEGLRQSFKGKIITLGKQDVRCTYNEVLALAQKMNYPLKQVEMPELSHKPEMKVQGFISDQPLFFS